MDRTPPRDDANRSTLSRLGGRLRWRLLGWLLLFSLLPLLASNTLGYLRSRGIIERLIERQVQALAQLRAQQVGDALQRQLQELQAVAAGNEFLASGALLASGRGAGAMGPVADRAALERHLTRKHEELPALDALFLLRAEGALVVHTGRRDEAALRLPERMPLTYSLLPGPSPRLRLLVPVRDEHRLTVGYLGGIIGPRGFGLLFDIPAGSPEDIRSFILDGEGRPLFAAGVSERLEYGRPLLPSALGEAGAVAHYRGVGGDAVVGTLARIPTAGWLYLAEAPVGQVLTPLLRLRSLSLGFAAGLCLILLATGWLVAGGIVAPVRRLVDATRRIGAGELNIRVPEEAADEIGELASAFNDMAGRLEEASRRVRELHQREIERAQQLATVGELASGVAHEIKNPVVGIGNGLDLVRRRLHGDATLDPIMEEMSRQLKRIEGAVRDLLSYARPAAPSLSEVRAEPLVARATRLVQPAAERAGVALALELAPDSPTVHADQELLTQALVNLLMNAVQATSAGGRITVAAQRYGQALRLVVADTGCGIAADDLEHVFKPFFTTRHTGSGLGLSITRDIVERHGGRLEVQSVVGEGTSFTLLLPAADQPAASEPPPERERVVA